MTVDIGVKKRGGEDVVEKRVVFAMIWGRGTTLWGSKGWIIEVVDLRESDSTGRARRGSGPTEMRFLVCGGTVVEGNDRRQSERR